jgi:hypothetical protein
VMEFGQALRAFAPQRDRLFEEVRHLLPILRVGGRACSQGIRPGPRGEAG